MWYMNFNYLIDQALHEQYKRYLEEINNLIAQDPDLNTSEGERLSLLAMAVKEYEGKHFFFNKPSPIEAIRFRMEEQGLIQNDLISDLSEDVDE